MGDQQPVNARLVRASRKQVTKALQQDVANLAFVQLISEGERTPTDCSFTLSLQGLSKFDHATAGHGAFDQDKGLVVE